MFEQWPSIDSTVTGIQPAMVLRPNEILRTIERALAGQGYLEWARYAHAAELHRQLDADIQASDFLQDAYVQCAARLAAAQQLSQVAAEHHLTCALALRDRLPRVADALKHGDVAPHHIPAIVSRTDLIEGTEHSAEIDREIAEQCRRRGSWSRKSMRDMIDATIFRRDPTLVREDRKDAHDKRGVWGDNKQNGMGELNAVLSAEHTAMILQRLEKLAGSTCRRDPRIKPQRMSDALFAITMAREFTCQCDDDPDHPCTAEIVTVPADGVISGIDAKIVLHAIANQSTLDGIDEQPGYLEGHGVINADHARDLADQSHTTTRRMGNATVPAPAETQAPTPDASGAQGHSPNSDPTVHEPCPSPPPAPIPTPNRKSRRAARKNVRMQAPPDPRLAGISDDDWQSVEEPRLQVIPLPVVQPGDHYRPSAVLDAFIRIRDLYCTWPGCNKSAWTADLDHTAEYNHRNPEAGGRTHPTGLKALCRFHHMLKTHSAETKRSGARPVDWLDDQSVDTHGRTTTVIITPEGRTYPGPAWTGEDLFPASRTILWDNNSLPPPNNRPPSSVPITRPRTEAKHQRRQQERARNRLRRQDDVRVSRAEEAVLEERPPRTS
jgi:hypothetical protein